MKKLLLVLAIGAFVACNNSSDSTKSADSTATSPSVDTSAVKPMDSLGKAADTTAKPVDTTKK